MQLPHTHPSYVRSLLTDDVAKTVTCSILASELDYCNGLLHGAPTTTFDVFQHMQINLARVICQCDERTDGGPLLRAIHWLPVRH